MRGPHEDTAWLVYQARFQAACDQAHDQVLQVLAVTGAILVPDHQVHGQALQSPVGMGQHHLPDQVDVGGIADLHQHHRHVA